MDIIAIAICATICGAASWVHIELFGKSKLAWFQSFLELPHGIPSHDTLGNVFARLDPAQLQNCFVAWTQAIAELLPGEAVAIDGKTARRSYDRAGKKGRHPDGQRLGYATNPDPGPELAPRRDTGSRLTRSPMRSRPFPALDFGVTFREGQRRVRKNHGPQNIAMLRQIGHNLLKNERTLKVGIQGKRINSGWDKDYLLKVLLQ